MADLQKITYSLQGGLSADQVEQMHRAMLGLCGTVGMKVGHAPIRELAARNRGVTDHGGRLTFEAELVEEAIAAQSYPPELFECDFDIVSGAYCLNVTDLQDGRIRPATHADLYDLTKLADSYGMLGSAPVLPRDLPGPLQEIALQKAVFEVAPRKHVPALDANPRATPEVAEAVFRMAEVVGAEIPLGAWVISPFRINDDDLNVIYHHLHRRCPLWIATMPIMGATSPIFPVGSYVQSLAELFAGLTLLHVIGDGVPVYCSVIDSVRAYPFDMRYGSFVYGSPEDLWATLLQVQLNGRYGIPVCAKSLLTASREPDAHAAAEKSAHTMAAALAGARLFTNAGLLSVDEIYSPEQVVLDYEIVQYAKATLRGFEFSEDSMAVEAIRQVAQKGTFLEHDTTLDNYRTAFWEPELFDHRMLQTWQADGAKELRERLRETARGRIAAHDFHLPEDQQRALDAIWEECERGL
ncbi:MAG: trimethylamine methyltransferase family protein [Armatimonadia bacterium]